MVTSLGDDNAAQMENWWNIIPIMEYRKGRKHGNHLITTTVT